MIGNDVFERVSWWNTWNPNKKGRAKTDIARMVNDEGQPLPPGRALLAELDADTAQCTAAPQD